MFISEAKYKKLICDQIDLIKMAMEKNDLLIKKNEELIIKNGIIKEQENEIDQLKEQMASLEKSLSYYE